jgi:iron complex outermembrane recepter protein
MKTKNSFMHQCLPMRSVAQAVSLMLLAAAAAHAQTAESAVNLSTVDVSGKAPVTLLPAEVAPSQGNLEAASAQSIVSDNYVRNFLPPTADYTQVLNITPGAYSFTSNGIGLGDTKVSIRGLSDGYSVISYDGIPFNDTNSVSHHSWAFFPSMFVGGAVVDRSPGSAATIGQSTFAGSYNLNSRVLSDERSTDLTLSSGSWNTKLVNVEHSTGRYGENGESKLMFNVHEMKSDGYQTYNYQDRKGFSLKYERDVSPDTKITAFTSYLSLKNNTPGGIKGVTRNDYNSGNYNLLLTNDTSKGSYYGYNLYDLPSDFSYIGIQTQLDNGWKLEDKFYRYSYHNSQHYASSASTLPANPANSGVDKLNAYTTYGNVLRLSKATDQGILRTGLWLERADSHRYQIQSNPTTWLDVSAPTFQETYVTTTVQPYIEHEFKIDEKWRITPGLKFASYKQDYVHNQDTSGVTGAGVTTAATGGVGPLGGTLGGVINGAYTTITGGQASIGNSATYTDWLPSLSTHYAINPQWAAYAQYAYGDQIPPTSVYDVTGAKVSPAPKPVKAKASQIGTVWNSPDLIIAGNLYHIGMDGAYSSTLDANGNTAYYMSGSQVSQGIDGEITVPLGNGFSLYMNGMVGSVKNADGTWVQNAPSDTETVAMNYQQGPWKAMLSASRIGRSYKDGKNLSGAVVSQAFTIDPVTVTNLFVNYTIRHEGGDFAKQTRLQLGVNNLFNQHSIVDIASGAKGSTSAAPYGTDVLTVLPARSVNLSATVSF